MKIVMVTEYLAPKDKPHFGGVDALAKDGKIMAIYDIAKLENELNSQNVNSFVNTK